MGKYRSDHRRYVVLIVVGSTKDSRLTERSCSLAVEVGWNGSIPLKKIGIIIPVFSENLQETMVFSHEI